MYISKNKTSICTHICIRIYTYMFKQLQTKIDTCSTNTYMYIYDWEIFRTRQQRRQKRDYWRVIIVCICHHKVSLRSHPPPFSQASLRLLRQRLREPAASSFGAHSAQRFGLHRFYRLLWGRLLDWCQSPIHCFASLLQGAFGACVAGHGAVAELPAALVDFRRLWCPCWHSVASVRCFSSTGRVVTVDAKKLR